MRSPVGLVKLGCASWVVPSPDAIASTSSRSIVSGVRVRPQFAERLAHRFAARDAPELLRGAVGVHEPPLRGVLHHDRDRHVVENLVEEIPLPLDFAFDRLQLADVLDGRNPPAVGHRPIGYAQLRLAVERLHDMDQHAAGARVLDQLGKHLLRIARVAAGRLAPVEQLEQRHADQVVGRKLHEVDVALVEHDDAAFRIEHAQPLLHALERRVELLLGIASRFARALTACNIVACVHAACRNAARWRAFDGAGVGRTHR